MIYQLKMNILLVKEDVMLSNVVMNQKIKLVHINVKLIMIVVKEELVHHGNGVKELLMLNVKLILVNLHHKRINKKIKKRKKKKKKKKRKKKKKKIKKKKELNQKKKQNQR